MANDDKLYIQENLNTAAARRAAEAIQGTGRALPCTVTEVNGALVTVQFEVVAPYTLYPLTLPKAESQWLRAPVQVGDVGMTVSADTLVSTASGVGSGTPDVRVNYGNHGPTLVWVPIANVNFGTTPDPNKAWINGPNGAVLSDTAQTVGVTCDHALQLVTIYAGGNTIVLSADPAIVATVIGMLGNLQTVVDGATNAISTVVPTGGVVALGKLAADLSTTANAVTRFTDLDSAIKNQITQMIGNSHIQLLTAIVANGGLPTGASATSLLGTLASSGFPIPGSFFALLSSLHGITTPACSQTVLSE